MREQLQYIGYFGVAGLNHVLKKKRCIHWDNERYLDNIHANQFMLKRLQSKEAFMACRFGSGEMLAFIKTLEVKMGLRRGIPEGNMRSLCMNAGFFPSKQDAVMRFGDVMEDACKQVDLLGIWESIPMEPYLLHTRLSHARFCGLAGLEPFFADRPWSSALRGRKVLVIHPFVKSIRQQYKKHPHLFQNPDILPDFELYTLQAVQTIAGEQDNRFKDWFAALEYMYEEAMKTGFEVAIVGCGAYGFPLAAKLKKAGKQVIHLGGSTQILFGIRGNRWDQRKDFQELFNEYWTRPLPEEIPEQAKKIENACYW